MRFGPRLSAAAAILVGGLLGWLAANAQFDSAARADPGRQSERRTTIENVAGCCKIEGGRAGLLAMAPATAAAPATSETSKAQPDSRKKPNILVIFGDDIGQANVSAYTMGLMGYRTPSIERIAKEGMIFADHYAEQSCTAHRSTFITG
jgi:Sulfatase